MTAMTAVERVYAEAMELSEGELDELVARLLAARDEAPPAGWWESIAPEMERRSAAIRSGESTTIPWNEVQRRIRERLDGSRDSIL